MTDDTLRTGVLKLLDDHLTLDAATAQALADMTTQRDGAVSQVATLQGTVTSLQGSIADLNAQIAKLLQPSGLSRGAAAIGSMVFDGAAIAPDLKSYVIALNGNDANPGTEASPKRNPVKGAINRLRGGTWAGFTIAGILSAKTVLIPYSAPGLGISEQVTLDGQGTVKNLFYTAAPVYMLGLHVTGYCATSTDSAKAGAMFFGGVSQGSVIKHCLLENFKFSAVEGMTPNVTISHCTIQDCGYLAIGMGTSDPNTRPDNFLLDSNIIRRINKDKHDIEDGRVSACKTTRAKNVRYINNYVEDTNGARALWFDVSCLDAVAVMNEVNTNPATAGTPCAVAILVEETERGVVLANLIKGAKFGVYVVASGSIRVWGNDSTATVCAIGCQQERSQNSGAGINSGNRSNAEAPWWTVNNEFVNNKGTAPVAFMAYADSAAKGKLVGKDMIKSFMGNAWTGTVEMGRTDGGRDTLTATQLASYLGAKYSTTKQAVPPELAALTTA